MYKERPTGCNRRTRSYPSSLNRCERHPFTNLNLEQFHFLIPSAFPAMAEKTNIPYDTISNRSVSTQSIFTKCCCCIPLRIGCFILGYMNLVLNIFQTLTLIAVTTFIGVSTHGFDHFDSRTSSDEGTSTDLSASVGMDQHILTEVGVFLVVMVIANVFWLFINIACLVGLHKKQTGPIRVYVGFATARLMLSLAAFVYLVMTNKSHSSTIVTHSIDLGLTAYFILVYYIYAVKLEKERETEIAQSAAAPVNNVFLYPANLDKSHLVA